MLVVACIEHSLSRSDQMCCHLLDGNLSVTREFLPHTDTDTPLHSTGNEILPDWVNLNISPSIIGQIRNCREYLTNNGYLSISNILVSSNPLMLTYELDSSGGV